jgi:SsrA-binding protein
MQNKVDIKNKKAYFEFEILDKIEAGIQLKGTEVKSIRKGKASIKEAFCFFHKAELYVKSMTITEYEKGNIYNHDPARPKKLLLKKRELKKLRERVQEKGLTIVPLRLYFNDRGVAKLEIGLAKGKKIYDKRETMKEKDQKRAIERELKKRH